MSSRYERLRLIASGGMANVYLGRALGAAGFERLVAIKVMHPHIAADPEFVTMFLDEARLASMIRHPNVVSTLDIVQDEQDQLSLIMDYVDGMSLHQLVKDLRKAKRKIPTAVCLRILVDTLSGLHAAHDLKTNDGKPLHLVHRDVSPQNVLVGSDGVSRITDFGVARAEHRVSSTRVGQVKGKMGYMSIEQLMAQQVDRRSDVYSAGVVLWEALVGKRLFRGDSEAAIAIAAAAGPTESPRDANREVPQAVSDACMKALKRAASERFPTAALFAEALEDAAHAEGIRIAKAREVAELVSQQVAGEGPTMVRSSPDAAVQAIQEAARRAVAGRAEIDETSDVSAKGTPPPNARGAPPAIHGIAPVPPPPIPQAAPSAPQPPPRLDPSELDTITMEDRPPAAPGVAGPLHPAPRPNDPHGDAPTMPLDPMHVQHAPGEGSYPSASTAIGNMIAFPLPDLPPPPRHRPLKIIAAVAGVLVGVISLFTLFSTPTPPEPPAAASDPEPLASPRPTAVPQPVEPPPPAPPPTASVRPIDRPLVRDEGPKTPAVKPPPTPPPPTAAPKTPPAPATGTAFKPKTL